MDHWQYWEGVALGLMWFPMLRDAISWLVRKVTRTSYQVVQFDDKFAVRRRRAANGKYVDLATDLFGRFHWHPYSKHFKDCLTNDEAYARTIAQEMTDIAQRPKLKKPKVIASF